MSIRVGGSGGGSGAPLVNGQPTRAWLIASVAASIIARIQEAGARSVLEIADALGMGVVVAYSSAPTLVTGARARGYKRDDDGATLIVGPALPGRWMVWDFLGSVARIELERVGLRDVTRAEIQRVTTRVQVAVPSAVPRRDRERWRTLRREARERRDDARQSAARAA